MLPAAPRPASALLRLAAVLLLGAGLLLTVPATASAHTVLRTSEPAAGSTATTTPQAVTLTFSASVLGGEVSVTGPDGTPVDAGPVARDGAVLSVPVALTAAGPHTVTWTAVADDGHALDGTFVFEHAPATPLPTAAATTTPAPTTDGSGTPAAPPTGSGTDTASASSDAGGPPGWVLPVAAVALLTGAVLGVLRLRHRRG
ncbi:MAG TPA: copper resistance CopC family protein [Geodermatophilus sp.]|nr:copper resistance CopC family protein [Geodermatophilus sp.]